MSPKKLITFTADQKKFIEENEIRTGVKPASFISTALDFYISHRREVKAFLDERKKKQMEAELELNFKSQSNDSN